MSHTPSPAEYASRPAAERGVMVGIYAGMLVMLTVMEEEIARDPKSVEAALLSTWSEVERGYLSETRDVHSAAAVKFMHEYFHHAGDWGAIRKCVTAFAEGLQTDPQQLSRLLDRGVLEFRKVYRRRFGRVG